LHTLAVWLTDARCPHYFANNCNLFDHAITSYSVQHTAHQLMSITETGLSEWFTSKYIRECALLCPHRVSQMFDDVSTNIQLLNAVSAIVRFRANNLSYQHWSVFTTAQSVISQAVPSYSLNVTSCLLWITRLSKIDELLSVYFVAVTLLHVARETTTRSLKDEFLDVLATICLQFNDARRCLNARHSSLLSLSQGTKLMKVVANNSRSTVQLIEIKLSKSEAAYGTNEWTQFSSAINGIYYSFRIYTTVSKPVDDVLC